MSLIEKSINDTLAYDFFKLINLIQREFHWFYTHIFSDYAPSILLYGIQGSKAHSLGTNGLHRHCFNHRSARPLLTLNFLKFSRGQPFVLPLFTTSKQFSFIPYSTHPLPIFLLLSDNYHPLGLQPGPRCSSMGTRRTRHFLHVRIQLYFRRYLVVIIRLGARDEDCGDN